jgi:hypothetical protein
MVLNVAFSPAKAQRLHDLPHGNEEAGGDLLSPLLMAVLAVGKNWRAFFALMRGGEFAPFTPQRGFEIGCRSGQTCAQSLSA